MRSAHIRLLGGVFFAAAVALAVILFRRLDPSSLRPSSQEPTKEGGSLTVPLHLPERPTSEIHAEWRASVQRILAQYDQDHAARTARDALLLLTVASDDRKLHLSFVLALSGLAEHSPAAKEDLARARAAFERAQ